MQSLKNVIDYYKQLLQAGHDSSIILNELYCEFKLYADFYFNGELMDEEWIELLNELAMIEFDYIDGYIIDSTITDNFNDKFYQMLISKKKNIINNYPIEDILDFVIYYGRKYLIRGCDITKYNNKNVTNKCMIASKYIKTLAQKCGLKSYMIRIDPGFSRKHGLLLDSGFHYFNILEYQNKYYLVDVTYKQFFLKYDSYIERLGIPYTYMPTAGIYMMMNSTRKEVATTIIKNGWIELTPEVMKAYFDGFALSYRNGRYYEDHDLIFETDYTAEDYKRFLLSKDNQVNHEGLDALGYQTEPLKKLIIFNK